MKLILSLLSEKSRISSMRLMSIYSLIIASYLAIAGLYLNKDLIGLAALCSVFVTAAFGGKIIQKNIEGRNQ